MTKKQIDELTQRVNEMEKRLDGVESKINQPKQRYGKIHMQRTMIKNAEPEPLKPLTPEETEFLMARGLDPEQRTMTMQIQSKQLTPHDQAIIKSIRAKRGLHVTYFA